jgi:hypothetical protein
VSLLVVLVGGTANGGLFFPTAEHFPGGKKEGGKDSDWRGPRSWDGNESSLVG